MLEDRNFKKNTVNLYTAWLYMFFTEDAYVFDDSG